MIWFHIITGREMHDLRTNIIFVCQQKHIKFFFQLLLIPMLQCNDSGHHNLGSFQKFCRRDLMFRWTSYKNMLLVECCKVGTHTKGHTYLGHVLNLQEQSWAPSDNCTWEIIFFQCGFLWFLKVCVLQDRQYFPITSDTKINKEKH